MVVVSALGAMLWLPPGPRQINPIGTREEKSPEPSSSSACCLATGRIGLRVGKKGWVTVVVFQDNRHAKP